MDQTIKDFFTDSEWDLIYHLVNNNSQFCEDTEDDPVEDYYSIVDKIKNLFEETDAWLLFFQWQC